MKLKYKKNTIGTSDLYEKILEKEKMVEPRHQKIEENSIDYTYLKSFSHFSHSKTLFTLTLQLA